MAKGRLRTFLDDNPTIGLVAALLVMACSVGAVLFWLLGGDSGPKIVDVYFYDVETAQLFAGQSTDLPPIEAPSGGPGVRAYVYACNDCSDPNDRFVAWVEMYTPEYKEALLNPQTITPENPGTGANITLIMEEGHLVARPGSNRWIPAASNSSFDLTTVGKNCGGSVPITCVP